MDAELPQRLAHRALARPGLGLAKGVAVGTLAIGEAGAANAGLLAAQVVALQEERVRDAVIAFRQQQTETVLASSNSLELDE